MDGNANSEMDVPKNEWSRRSGIATACVLVTNRVRRHPKPPLGSTLWDSASRTQKEELCRRSFGSDAVQEMEVWPSDVGLRGQASNHPVLRWLKTVVVSDREKVWHDRIRWGPGRRARKCPTRVTREGVAIEASL
jgi:hypothetical protein